MVDRHISLLMVDDEADLLHVMSQVLRTHGYEVDTALNGPEALEKTKQKNYDVILLDISMPEMDGYETCKHLRAEPVTSKVPIIMFTSLNGKQNVIQAIQAGATDFCIKSVDVAVLIVKIKEVLEVSSKAESSEISEDIPPCVLNRGKVDVMVRHHKNLYVNESLTRMFDIIFSQKTIDDHVMTTGLSMYPFVLVEILRRANKRLNKKKVSIDSIQDLIRHFGTKNINSFVQEIAKEQQAEGMSPPAAIDFVGLQLHGVACASVARMIALEQGCEDPEEVYLVALFHDVGKYMLAEHYPDEYLRVVSRACTDKLTVRESEHRMFGIDHAFVGFRFFDEWGFSKEIQFSVFHHHHMTIHFSDSQKDRMDLARYIFLADAICKASGFGFGGDNSLEDIPSAFWESVPTNFDRASHWANQVYRELSSHLMLLDADRLELQYEVELNRKCRDHNFIVFHNASDRVNLLALGLSLRGAEVERVDNLADLAQALQFNSESVLILAGRSASEQTPLENPMVNLHVRGRPIIMLVFDDEDHESVSFSQTKFLKRPVTIRQVVDAI